MRNVSIPLLEIQQEKYKENISRVVLEILSEVNSRSEYKLTQQALEELSNLLVQQRSLLVLQSLYGIAMLPNDRRRIQEALLGNQEYKAYLRRPSIKKQAKESLLLLITEFLSFNRNVRKRDELQRVLEQTMRDADITVPAIFNHRGVRLSE